MTVEHNYPILAQMEERLGTRVTVVPPNPTVVYKAELVASRGHYAVRVSAVGFSEDDALQRLESLLEEIRQ